MNIVVVCNPENRRADLFCNAARGLGLAAPQRIAYTSILENEHVLDDALGPNTLLRIESPGENFEVERRIIARGADIVHTGNAGRISEVDARNLRPDHGRIRFLRQWFLGFGHVLRQIQQSAVTSGCSMLNTPDAIRLMFDKRCCQRHLQDRQIPIPRLLPELVSYHALREQIQEERGRRLFIKPSHASSASGVLAYRAQGHREEIFAPIALERVAGEVKLYNSLKVRRYTDRTDIRILVDFILREGAVVEEWIPKASLQGKIFDLRVVVINGRAQFTLPRLSAGPITNLHLGNQRGPVSNLRERLGSQCYDQAMHCAEAAVRSLNGAFYAGVDVLIPAGFGQPRVLEINAFGDLLPGLTNVHGHDTYTATLKEWMYAA
ncbi:STM4014 family protein [Fulvivirgaceae bacterium PWU5]|uniref:STM4014 family protein n=1 Tax=Dawidia cretensis TaxID=2782350 RepID=A0AAP2E2V9_9BACT|nr:STM4014 family protein [Dawidia cretensis]MBT1710702.1 STM4014 family protein [Dawidia cretensis]